MKSTRVSRFIKLDRAALLENRQGLTKTLVVTRRACLNLLFSINDPGQSIHKLPVPDQQAILDVLKRLHISLEKLHEALFCAYENEKNATVQDAVQHQCLESYISGFNESFWEWQGNVEAGAHPLDCKD